VQRKRKKLWKERQKDLTEPALLEMDGNSVNRGLHAETEKQRDIALTWRPLATHGLLFIMTEL
jgi:hypothetical protein